MQLQYYIPAFDFESKNNKIRLWSLKKIHIPKDLQLNIYYIFVHSDMKKMFFKTININLNAYLW